MFEGDNRRFDPTGQGGYRTRQQITIETDPRKSGRNPQVAPPKQRIETTVMLSPIHAIWERSGSSGLTVGASRAGADGSWSVTVRGTINVGNPFTAEKPPITATFILTFAPDGSFVGGTVWFGGFPAIEIYVTNENGTNVVSFQYKPADKGCDEWCLLPGVGDVYSPSSSTSDFWRWADAGVEEYNRRHPSPPFP